MYSTGLPILYPITMIYFAFSYFYNKILLLRYYERTVEFDQDLPIISMKLIKVGIYAHYVINYFMIFNENLFGQPQIADTNFFYET